MFLLAAVLGVIGVAGRPASSDGGAVQPTVIHVVADDLGFNDLGFMNGNKTHTPHINLRVAQGVWLSRYHTYKVCSPTRASILTGRYPWGVGYYDMVGPLAVPLDFTMLPAVLAAEGWATHAIGKWNLGATVKAYTPTFRGFDTFFGYYNAALGDYWYHFGSSPGCNASTEFCTDLSNSSGSGEANGVRPALDSLNGTYDQEIFAAEAVRLIEQHGGPENPGGMYMYLAFQNVHTTSQNPRTLSGSQPFQAPCLTVDTHYGTTVLDAHKVLGAMVTELDYGVGNVTAALEAAGRPWLMIFTADNGGPVDLGNTNAPLRGGKHTLWDGGVRVMAFISGPLVPAARWGTRWDGLAHSSDWYPTVIQGVARLALPSHTGPRPVDGFNLWDPVLSNGTSPRVEVIHQVTNNYTVTAGIAFPAVIQSGRYKLFVGKGDPGDATVAAWPAPGVNPVPFGLSNGTRDAYPEEKAAGTQHCRSPHLITSVVLGHCGSTGCLFDVEADPSESVNLIADPAHAEVVRQLTARLAEAASTGPEWAWPISKDALKTLNPAICDAEVATGYYEPVLTTVPPPSPPPPPPPTFVWQPCIDSLKAHCPYTHPPNLTHCEACGSKVCNRTVTVDKYCHRAPGLLSSP